jgi:hypothetical protein
MEILKNCYRYAVTRFNAFTRGIPKANNSTADTKSSPAIKIQQLTLNNQTTFIRYSVRNLPSLVAAISAKSTQRKSIGNGCRLDTDNEKIKSYIVRHLHQLTEVQLGYSRTPKLLTSRASDQSKTNHAAEVIKFCQVVETDRQTFQQRKRLQMLEPYQPVAMEIEDADCVQTPSPGYFQEQFVGQRHKPGKHRKRESTGQLRYCLRQRLRSVKNYSF